MKHIAFYLYNKEFDLVDCSNIFLGNPGIGGTMYEIIATTYFLTKLYPDNYCYELYAEAIDNLPKEISCTKVENMRAAIGMAIENKIDYLVLFYWRGINEVLKVLPDDSSLKIIIWVSDFIHRDTCNLDNLSKNKSVKRIVCVGHEQMDFYRDHPLFNKSVVICNGVPANNSSKKIQPFYERPNEVTYMGSFIKEKGFHVLAKAWADVLKAVPDAHLNVIGSGKLYNRNAKLGKWGIAEETVENSFMPYLTQTDEKGNLEIMPSVTFWGVLGNEKFDILGRTKAGVPNPSAISETFCITALEMQQAGALVTTKRFGGFLDTVYKSGLLYKNTNRLTECIVTLLSKKDNNYGECLDWIENNFSFNVVCKNWIDMFDEIERGETVKPKPIYYKSFLNRVSEFNRKIKTIPGGQYLPTIMMYKNFIHRLKRIFFK